MRQVRVVEVVVLTVTMLGCTALTGCRRHGPRGAKQPAYAPAGPSTYEPTSAPQGYAPQPGDVEAQNRGGSCEAACQHYLTCRQIGDPNVAQQCLVKCAQANFAPQALAEYVQTDCQTAISIVEGSGQGSTGGRSKACQGCVWDGSSCIWLSSGNWGPGPYSGAAAACDPGCCPGH